MMQFKDKPPILHHAMLLLSILFVVLLVIVKFSNVYLFVLAFASIYITYKTKPSEYNLKSYLTFGDETTLDSGRKMIKLVASPVTNYLPPFNKEHQEKFEYEDVENFIESLGVLAEPDRFECKDVVDLFSDQIERINNDKGYYADGKFSRKLLDLISSGKLKSKKLDDKIKHIASSVAQRLDELYKNHEYGMMTVVEKQKIKDEMYDDIRERVDLPSNIRSNIVYFVQEYYHLPKDRIDKINELVSRVGAHSLNSIKKCFVDINGKLKRIHHLHSGDYRYHEVLDLEKRGFVVRVVDIAIEDLLTQLHIDELEQIAAKIGLKPTVGKVDLVAQLLESDLNQENFGDHLSASDFFEIDKHLISDRRLLMDSIKYLAVLYSTQEYLNEEFRVYVDSFFLSIKKSA